MIAAPHDIWGINCFTILVNQLSEPRALALLGVSKRVLKNWLSERTPVPRMAVLALFWETPYGRGIIDSDHLYQIQLLTLEKSLLKQENVRIRSLLESTIQTADFGCANDPVMNY